MILALDAFCGLGGWTTGARRTGRISVRVAINHCPDAIRWHSAAHPETRHVAQDIAEFDFGRVRDELRGGILFASPACQGFSGAGQPARRGTGGNGRVNIAVLMQAHRGKRNTAMAVISAADVLEPDLILVENVERFTRWRLFDGWLGMLETLGYATRVHVLNARDYGVPQDRRRVIVTASRLGALELEDRWGAAASDIASCLEPDANAANRWERVDRKPTRTRDLIRDRQRAAGLERGLLNNVGDGVRMRPLSDVAPTLTTRSGGQLMLVDGDRVRTLNPCELARLQGWRDDEVRLPRRRDLASRLIGNAIPVGLAEGVCEQALAALAA